MRMSRGLAWRSALSKVAPWSEATVRSDTRTQTRLCFRRAALRVLRDASSNLHGVRRFTGGDSQLVALPHVADRGGYDLRGILARETRMGFSVAASTQHEQRSNATFVVGASQERARALSQGAPRELSGRPLQTHHTRIRRAPSVERPVQ